MTDYRNVKIPDEMVKEIKRIISKHPELGYRTHAEFIIEGARKLLIDIKKIIEVKNIIDESLEPQ